MKIFFSWWFFVASFSDVLLFSPIPPFVKLLSKEVILGIF